MSTFILVHGSWHGAWNWHKVVPLLEKAGHKAIALDMPGHELDKTPLAEVTLQSCLTLAAKTNVHSRAMSKSNLDEHQLLPLLFSTR